jgi:dGTPase
MFKPPDKPAIFSVLPNKTEGRLYNEPESNTRTCFQRDRDRIIHSTAFRRLKYKTQVFVYHEGDHYRTRLTHSLEVSQIARSICRFFGLNEDLAETLSLAHDLGHTPFGHAGEDALEKEMDVYGGFNHNAQALRIVTNLEKKYINYDGLNLTWETLEGLAKHNGPYKGRNAIIHSILNEYNQTHNLKLDKYPSMEAQISSISDDIAYNNHDLDDGLRAGLFDFEEMYSLPLAGKIIKDILSSKKNIDQSRLIHHAVRNIIKSMVDDVIVETQRRLNDIQPTSFEDIQNANISMVGFSSEMKEIEFTIKNFLYEKMYKHEKVLEMSNNAKIMIKKLFTYYFSDKKNLPKTWVNQLNTSSDKDYARLVSDFIAGMTDRFAINQFKLIESLSE